MNDTAVTQGDTPAVEATAVALTADRQPPELPERKADCERRLKAAGLWEEAYKLLVAARIRFRKQGLGVQEARDAAWAAVMKAYPLADKAVDDDADEPEPEEEEELDDSDNEAVFDDGLICEELAELDRRCRDQPVDLIRDVKFAYANMMRPVGSVRPLDCPSPGSWAQLRIAQKMKPEAYTRLVVNPILIRAEREKNKKSSVNDREEQIERLDKLRAGLGCFG